MKRALVALPLVALMVALPMAAQPARIASDFELAQMERQLAQSRGFEAQLAGRLNLGDVRISRGEPQLARNEYQRALELAERERNDARLESDLTRYAHATSYAALVQAKLGNAATAFVLLEESIRYGSDDAETWNLYASAMRHAERPQKAVSAAKNAVAIAAQKDDPLDLAVYQYALATALDEAGGATESAALLEALVTSIHSDAFRGLRDRVARAESFEVYSSARGDVAAYVSLLNRTQLRLAALYESQGATAAARTLYEAVLEGRSDDATALAGLARLALRESDRERHYEAAFDANPFAPALIDDYRQHLRDGAAADECSASTCTTGARMRTALALLERGNLRAARATLDILIARFPANEILHSLRPDAEGESEVMLPASSSPSAQELEALLQRFERLTPEQRVALDAMTFTSGVHFDKLPDEPEQPEQPTTSATTFARGSIEDVPFRFSAPAAFAGTFAAEAPLRLTYRILGVTRDGDRHVLLLEPIRLEQSS